MENSHPNFDILILVRNCLILPTLLCRFLNDFIKMFCSRRGQWPLAEFTIGNLKKAIEKQSYSLMFKKLSHILLFLFSLTQILSFVWSKVVYWPCSQPQILPPWSRQTSSPQPWWSPSRSQCGCGRRLEALSFLSVITQIAICIYFLRTLLTLTRSC